MARRKESRKLPVELLSVNEIERLLKTCNKYTPSGSRDRALISTLISTAGRIGEVLDLELKDVDLDAGTVCIRHGKGDKQRTVGIDEGRGAILQQWLDKRAKLDIGDSQLIFCQITRNKAGQPLSQDHVRGMLKRRAKRAKIKKRVHCHNLRHVRANQLRAQGVDLLVIQRALGHSRLQTTIRYIDAVSNEAVIQAMKENPLV